MTIANNITRTLWVVTPCFYDANSFAKLRRSVLELEGNLPSDLRVRFILVDDSGGQDAEAARESRHADVILSRTPYNLGHQGAIVFGLRKLSRTINDADFVVTMDSDGEDCPHDILKLLQPLLKESGNLFRVVLAERTKRSESFGFKVCYVLFKAFFSMATGRVVRNGNFAAFRGWMVSNVLFHPYFDLCYSSSLLALPLQRSYVPLARGERYFGKSKMTMISLVLHGFRMLLPFAEHVAFRASAVSAILFALAVMSGACFCVTPSTSLQYAPLMVATFFPFVLANLGVICACIFFQIFNQSRAIALRGVSCEDTRFDMGELLDELSPTKFTAQAGADFVSKGSL